MRPFSLEHGRTAYWIDFAVYGVAIVAMTALLGLAAPHKQWSTLLLLALAGISLWTFAEYAIHRFVLHGMAPFKAWHERHHEEPTALICTPTIVTVVLVFALVFCPASLIGGWWNAVALTLGVTIGYVAYSLLHHAMHHWRPGSEWLLQRKKAHALHHHMDGKALYGVTSRFWDQVFDTLDAPDNARLRNE